MLVYSVVFFMGVSKSLLWFFYPVSKVELSGMSRFRVPSLTYNLMLKTLFEYHQMIQSKVTQKYGLSKKISKELN